MRLRDYFAGQRIVLTSPLSIEEVQTRINAATPVSYWPFANGVRGKAWMGRVRLSYTGLWFFDYNAKPVLAGTLSNRFGRTLLEANYRAPVFAYLFFAMWYLILIIIGATLFSAWLDDDLKPGGFFSLPLFGISVAAPLFMHYVFTRRADEELEAIIDLLATEAEFAIGR